MRVTLFAVLALAVVAGPAVPGQLALYSNIDGTDCHLTAPTSGLFVVHVFHENPGPDVIASLLFSAPVPPCMSAFVVDFVSPFVVSGDINSGLSVWYQACAPPDDYVGMIRLVGSGESMACCQYALSPHAAFGCIGILPCFENSSVIPHSGSSSAVIVNPDGSCSCTVATRGSTWGKVKSLYRD